MSTACAYKMPLKPLRAGYAIDRGVNADYIKLEGGLGKSRRSVIGKSSEAQVEWKLTPNEFNFFQRFYRSATAEGSTPFLMDLILDCSALMEYECLFRSVAISQPVGSKRTVTATLEVSPMPYCTEHDLVYMELWRSISNDGACDTDWETTAAELFSELEQLVINDIAGLPQSIPVRT